MVATTLNGVMLTGDHASRPAASGVAKGTLYSCTTHSLIYQSDSSSWTTWATLGGTASGSITASGYTQNTAKMLGRTTGSSGAIEEITVGSGLSLSAGSLTATGGSSGALIFLEAHTASTSAQLDFTTFSTTYEEYVFSLINVIPSTDAVDFQVRVGTGGGPTYDTGANYDWTHKYTYIASEGTEGASNTSIFKIRGSVTNSTMGTSGEARLYTPTSSTLYKGFLYHTTSWVGAVGAAVHDVGAGTYKQTTAVTGIRFFMSSGNIASGTIRMYGVTKS